MKLKSLAVLIVSIFLFQACDSASLRTLTSAGPNSSGSSDGNDSQSGDDQLNGGDGDSSNNGSNSNDGSSSLSGFPGCSVAKQVVFTQAVKSSDKMDILFVLDGSGSMADERKSLGDQLGTFISALTGVKSDLDYRIGVILAHAGAPYAGKLYQSADCVGDKKVLGGIGADSYLSDVDEHFRCKLTKTPPNDSTASQNEAGFSSIYQAITVNLDENRNQGFFRSDAALAVVFLSDENEICNLPDGQSPGDASTEAGFRASSYCVGMNPSAIYNQLNTLMAGRPLSIAAMVNTNPADGHYSYGYIGNETNFGKKGIVELAGANGTAVTISANAATVSSNLLTIGQKTLVTLTKNTAFNIPITALHVMSVSVADMNLANSDYTFLKEVSQVQIPPDKAGNNMDKIVVNYCE